MAPLPKPTKASAAASMSIPPTELIDGIQWAPGGLQDGAFDFDDLGGPRRRDDLGRPRSLGD